MHKLISILQILSAVLLVLFILLQTKGSGLSEAFGGTNTFYSVKRGPEKFLFIATIVLSVIFFVSTFLLSIIKQ